MTTRDRLDEIQARADKARDGLRPYVDGYVPLEETIDEVLELTAADAVPALVAALRTVLDVCEKSELGAYPEPTYDEYIPGQLDTAERVREAITAALNDN